MKTFVLTETVTTTKRFTAAEYRAYFGPSSQDHIQKSLNNDNGQLHGIIMSSPIGVTDETRTSLWTMEEDPCST